MPICLLSNGRSHVGKLQRKSSASGRPRLTAVCRLSWRRLIALNMQTSRLNDDAAWIAPSTCLEIKRAIQMGQRGLHDLRRSLIAIETDIAIRARNSGCNYVHRTELHCALYIGHGHRYRETLSLEIQLEREDRRTFIHCESCIRPKCCVIVRPQI